VPESTTVNANLFSGSTLLNSDTTAEYGFYEMTGFSPQSGLKLRGDSSGSVRYALRMPISIVSAQVKGPFVDAFPQARPLGDATVTIDWKSGVAFCHRVPLRSYQERTIGHRDHRDLW
jgi:hypothetical protein